MTPFVSLASCSSRSSLLRRHLVVCKGRFLNGSRGIESGRAIDKAKSPPPSPNNGSGATAGEQPSPPTPITPHVEPPPLFNPFPLLAHATENIDLTSRLLSYSNTFGIIGALMCSLSLSALGQLPVSPAEADESDGVALATPSSQSAPSEGRVGTVVPSPAGTESHHRSSILVKYLGIPREHLEDIYTASWTASFYASAIGLGLSTVVAGIVAATAPSYVKIFVRRHSEILCYLPVCQALSGGFAGLGLFLGLDQTRGEPVSWIGLVGVSAGGALLAGSSVRALKGYNAARSAGKVAATIPPKDAIAKSPNSPW